MIGGHDPSAIAKAIIDANLYMVLATADPSGRPWASPVYFAPAAYREFFWVSSPEGRHSRNFEARREVSIVIFDSTVPINTGQAVYMSAVAEEQAGEERADGLGIYSQRAREHGGSQWTVDDVQPPARHRFYRATAVEQYVLDEHDNRVPVTL
jgi:nitroimidazol reductase NimA-like FMN-containing flavoprotein (pyridoxamine 5'-phosphate oxidase superfamily)